jgi:N-methylhydantoinase A
MNCLIGIDVGGTFTDAVMITGDGEIRVAKAVTTPNQSISAVESVAKLGEKFEDVAAIVHGTTVATNAILERKGADVGLLTTDGFRDVLEFQRQERRNIWDLFAEKPEPLVPRRRRLGVPERMMANGEARQALDVQEARARIAALKRQNCTAIAVCLLNSYANPAHEQMLAQLLKEEAPDIYAAISSVIAPHFREYDRMSTTVLSAYVGPKIRAYLSEFRRRFADQKFAGDILVMGSNGGVLPPETASDHAAATCLSGPAGGVIATVQVARELGIKNAISFDMGGTSTDVSLIRNGAAAMSNRSEISGLPISLPQIHIETVSAGGGSIASIDSGGLLHVGPQSAGSNPGPACYGFGGMRPTVTDAAFLMGLLRPSKFFGGEMGLDHGAATKAYEDLVATLATSIEDVAEKVYTIANHKMANAVRVVSVREGHDPRDYALFAFGGAGPLHACAIAEELGISRVVIPMYPGAFSAYGLLCADLRRDFVRSVLKPLAQIDEAKLAEMMSELTAEGMHSLGEMAGRSPHWSFQAECRYRGQAYEVAVNLAKRAPFMKNLASRFHALHEQHFGFCEPDADIELVNLRAISIFSRRKPRLPEIDIRRNGKVKGDKGSVFAGGRWVDALFVARDTLAAGDGAGGPAVIEEGTATSYIPSGWRFTVHRAGHIEVIRG